MSAETPAPEQTPAAEGTPSKAAGPKPVILIAVIAVAALAGVGGGIVLAPRFAPAAAHASADAAEHGEEEEEAEGGGGHGGGAGKIFRLDNLIVNPAGSEGTRFLMTSVAFELESESAEAKLRAREVQVRDLVISRLESQTMATLTQPFARDSIKRQLAEAVMTVVGPKATVRVYLPQFVIQ
jgi:flagellar FliL protein